jgi:hypothetical protein
MCRRHWCPRSETITGFDALLTRLADGWDVQGYVFRQTFWLANARAVSVFHFTIARDGQKAKMIVVENPAVHRYLQETSLRTVQINVRKEMSQPQPMVQAASA